MLQVCWKESFDDGCRRKKIQIRKFHLKGSYTITQFNVLEYLQRIHFKEARGSQEIHIYFEPKHGSWCGDDKLRQWECWLREGSI